MGRVKISDEEKKIRRKLYDLEYNIKRRALYRNDEEFRSWVKKDMDAFNKRRKEQRDNLEDCYIIRLLKQQSKANINTKDIPKHLIDSKREEIVLKRERKKQSEMENKALKTNKMTITENMYTKEMAAAYLGLSLATLERYTKAGRISACTLGGKKKFYRKEVLDSLLKDDNKASSPS